MRIGALCIAGCLVRLALAQVPACEIVESDQIRAGDLARAIQAFGALPAETVVGLAPTPGTRRVLRTTEVLQLARKYSLRLEAPRDVCFEWKMEPLARSRVLDAMRRSLNLPDLTIELVEMSLYPVPAGEIEFAPEHLGVPARLDPPSPVLWRGNVIYGENRRFSIWARATLSTHVTSVIAASALKPGEPVLAAQIRTETVEGFPIRGIAPSLESVVGMMPIRPIPAGAKLRLVDLAAPKDINPGDPVAVEVRAGNTRLAITGTAVTAGRVGEPVSIRNPETGDPVAVEVRAGNTRLAITGTAVTAGRVGEPVSIRNPETRKTFQAYVTGKGTAAVQAGGIRGN